MPSLSSDCVALRRLLLSGSDAFAARTGEVSRSPPDGVDPPVATGVCSPVPVEVDGVGDDDVLVVDAAVGVWLAVVCLVELGSGVPDVAMAIWVWLTVVCPVELAGGGAVPAVDMAVGVRLAVGRSLAMAEVDSGGGSGVVVASVVVGAEVVVGGLALKQYLTGEDGREEDP